MGRGSMKNHVSLLGAGEGSKLAKIVYLINEWALITGSNSKDYKFNNLLTFRQIILDYIESKTKGLSHKKYVETLNNQCCTLRNPKKSNTIAVERNDETERNKDKNVDKESANDELIFSGEPSATDNQSKAKKRKVMSPSEN
ncbi:uncharacterized protein LOC127286042 isoform X1 [Leptopilina boulardi]|uniref:uncharacterized protein LOC127286042 isoform X1 n=1 Tax=Leptopilina boulardi TaxID=63433 RepID=UPI0021F558A9|nr:uncharacterized protein LOC127286042 isoform X1 [Leptopilina boulardi]